MPGPKVVEEITDLERALMEGRHKGATCGNDLTKPHPDLEGAGLVAKPERGSGTDVKAALLEKLALRGDKQVEAATTSGLTRLREAKLAGGKTGTVEL